MATLITVGNSEGSRRCDAKCYDAQHDKCHCVCGGRNHGVGIQIAENNTQEMVKDLTKQFGRDLTIPEAILQTRLGV